VPCLLYRPPHARLIARDGAFADVGEQGVMVGGAVAQLVGRQPALNHIRRGAHRLDEVGGPHDAGLRPLDGLVFEPDAKQGLGDAVPDVSSFVPRCERAVLGEAARGAGHVGRLDPEAHRQLGRRELPRRLGEDGHDLLALPGQVAKPHLVLGGKPFYRHQQRVARAGG